MSASGPEISPEEAAVLLGMSPRMVVHRALQGDIEHRRDGERFFLALADVLAFREAEGLRREALAEIGEHTDEMTSRNSGAGGTVHER